ncbi:MAG: ribose-phosphate pyrophosphokinase-like domain-containing protein [Bacteroidia bacterium]
MILNLHPSFNPWNAPPEQQIAFEAFHFPGGEPHIRLLSREDLHGAHVRISTRINGFSDLGILMLAVDALKRSGISSFELFIPYFPGARQDRVMTEGEPLTVKVFLKPSGAEKSTFWTLILPLPLPYRSLSRCQQPCIVECCLDKLANNICWLPDASAEKAV